MAFNFATEHQLEMAIEGVKEEIPALDGYIKAVKLTYTEDGEGIHHLADESGKNLTFTEVQTLINDEENFVYVIRQGGYDRCYLSLFDGNTIQFTNTYLDGEAIWSNCVKITTGETVTWTQLQIK